MTSSFPIKAFLLISLKNRHSEQKLSTREPEKIINRILTSMSSKTTSRNKIKVAVAMATREMAIAPPIFNREIKNLHKSALLSVQSFYNPISDFCWFKQEIMKITNFHIFSQNSLLCRGK